MSAPRVAVVQIAASADVARNLESAGRLVAAAAADGARLVVLPELFATGYDRVPFAEAAAAPVVEHLARWARETGATLVAARAGRAAEGTTIEAVVVERGGLVARYAKRNLWGPERAVFSPGRHPVTRMTPAGLAGLLVCYDLEFPEAARPYLAAGCRLVLAPAAFSTEHIWDLATRARALENACFVVAATLAGEGFCGRSRIVAPDGRVVAEVAKGEGFAAAAADWDAYADWRAAHPYARDLLPSTRTP